MDWTSGSTNIFFILIHCPAEVAHNLSVCVHRKIFSLSFCLFPSEAGLCLTSWVSVGMTCCVTRCFCEKSGFQSKCVIGAAFQIQSDSSRERKVPLASHGPITDRTVWFEMWCYVSSDDAFGFQWCLECQEFFFLPGSLKLCVSAYQQGLNNPSQHETQGSNNGDVGCWRLSAVMHKYTKYTPNNNKHIRFKSLWVLPVHNPSNRGCHHRSESVTDGSHACADLKKSTSHDLSFNWTECCCASSKPKLNQWHMT